MPITLNQVPMFGMSGGVGHVVICVKDHWQSTICGQFGNFGLRCTEPPRLCRRCLELLGIEHVRPFPAVVVNISHLPDDWRENPLYVYIGRANARKKLRGSVFYNPFPIGRSRDICLRRYRNYLARSQTLIKRARVELAGKILVCWCKPLACHGDALLELLAESSGRQTESKGSG